MTKSLTKKDTEKLVSMMRELGDFIEEGKSKGFHVVTVAIDGIESNAKLLGVEIIPKPKK
jgi:hypothetical protein